MNVGSDEQFNDKIKPDRSACRACIHGNGNHLGRGVELHCARAQGNHGVTQREVLVLQAFHVAQQLRLGMVQAENLMRQVRGRSGKGCRKGRLCNSIEPYGDY